MRNWNKKWLVVVTVFISRLGQSAGPVEPAGRLSVTQADGSPLNGIVASWGFGDEDERRLDEAQNIDSVWLTGHGKNCLLTRKDGSLVVVGNNHNPWNPIPTDLKEVVSANGAFLHSVAVQRDGRIRVWDYEHGLGENTTASDWIAAAAGWQFCVGVKQNGTVKVWGGVSSSEYGSPGVVPPMLDGVVDVATTAKYVLVLRSDGTMAGWGTLNGQKGWVSPALSGVIAVASGSDHFLALKRNGTVVAWGNTTLNAIKVPNGLSDVASIAAAGYRSAAIRRDGSIVTWGGKSDNSMPPSWLRAVKQMALTDLNGLALLHGHHFGYQMLGTESRAKQLRVTNTSSTEVAITEVRLSGPNSEYFSVSATLPLVLQPSGSALIEVKFAPGQNWYNTHHATLTLMSDGEDSLRQDIALTGMGGRPAILSAPFAANLSSVSVDLIADREQADFPTGSSQISFLLARKSYSGPLELGNPMVEQIDSNQEWPYFSRFRVRVSALLPETEYRFRAVSTNPAGSIYSTEAEFITPPQNTKSLSVETEHGEALGYVCYWGIKGAPPEYRIPYPSGLTHIKQIAVGLDWVAALTDAGSVKVWGSEMFSVPASLPSSSAISGGYFTIAAIGNDDNAYVWGSQSIKFPSAEFLNQVSALSFSDSKMFSVHRDGTVSGWDFSELGAAEVPTGLSDVVAISTGGYHTVALRRNGSAVGWGKLSTGSPFILTDHYDNIAAISSAGDVTFYLRQNGTVGVFGQVDAEIEERLLSLSGIKQVAAEGWTNFLALKSTGDVIYWGQDLYSRDYRPPKGLNGVHSIAASETLAAALRDAAYIDFPDTTISSEGETRTYTLKNTGSGSLSVHGIVLETASSGAFSVGHEGVPSALANGESATFAVKFTPMSRGAHRARVLVKTDDPEEPEFKIDLYGEGITQALALYRQWISQWDYVNIPPSVLQPLADMNNDGRANLLDYAVRDESCDAGGGVLRYQRRKNTKMLFQIFVSTDLKNFTPFALPEQVTSVDEVWEEVVIPLVPDSSASIAQFVKLAVSLP